MHRLGLPGKVFKRRKRLYIKAKQEPRFRFYTRYDRITRPDVLAAAWGQVAANDGAPGVDGVRIKDIENAPGGVERYLEELRETLKAKRYRPQAVRLKMIPKADGGERPLGIPSVRDRVVQTAAKLILEPIMDEPSDRHQPPRKVYRRAGTPQGGVISPLLANLYLHWMDKRFHDRDGPAHFSGAQLGPRFAP